MSSIETMVKAAYTVGRFQPPTLGHVRMIDALLEKANGAPAYVFVSSAKDSLISPELKVEFLTKMLTRGGVFPKNLTLVNTATCTTPCGGPLGGWGFLKDKGLVGPEVLLVVGGDQRDKFNPESAGMWAKTEPVERPSMFTLERTGTGAATFSSTKAREALGLSDKSKDLEPFLMDGSNAVTQADVARMAAALLAVKDQWPKKKTGGGEEDLSAFDDDLDGGRRRKTRRRKSRFMKKKRMSIRKFR